MNTSFLIAEALMEQIKQALPHLTFKDLANSKKEDNILYISNHGSTSANITICLRKAYCKTRIVLITVREDGDIYTYVNAYGWPQHTTNCEKPTSFDDTINHTINYYNAIDPDNLNKPYEPPAHQ